MRSVSNPVFHLQNLTKTKPNPPHKLPSELRKFSFGGGAGTTVSMKLLPEDAKARYSYPDSEDPFQVTIHNISTRVLFVGDKALQNKESMIVESGTKIKFDGVPSHEFWFTFDVVDVARKPEQKKPVEKKAEGELQRAGSNEPGSDGPVEMLESSQEEEKPRKAKQPSPQPNDREESAPKRTLTKVKTTEEAAAEKPADKKPVEQSEKPVQNKVDQKSVTKASEDDEDEPVTKSSKRTKSEESSEDDDKSDTDEKKSRKGRSKSPAKKSLRKQAPKKAPIATVEKEGDEGSDKENTSQGTKNQTERKSTRESAGTKETSRLSAARRDRTTPSSVQLPKNLSAKERQALIRAEFGIGAPRVMTTATYAQPIEVVAASETSYSKENPRQTQRANAGRSPTKRATAAEKQKRQRSSSRTRKPRLARLRVSKVADEALEHWEFRESADHILASVEELPEAVENWIDNASRLLKQLLGEEAVNTDEDSDEEVTKGRVAKKNKPTKQKGNEDEESEGEDIERSDRDNAKSDSKNMFPPREEDDKSEDQVDKSEDEGEEKQQDEEVPKERSAAGEGKRQVIDDEEEDEDVDTTFHEVQPAPITV